MEERIIRCKCGQRMRVPVVALGSTGACVQCKTPLTISMSTTTPFMREAESEEIHDPGFCTRCKRPFRGAWDRHQTDQGVICDICARQYCPPKKTDASQSPEFEEPFFFNPPPLSTNPRAPSLPNPVISPWQRIARITQSKFFAPLMFLAIAGAVMTLVLTLPVEEFFADLFFVDPENTASHNPAASSLMILVVRKILDFTACFATLFLTLLWADKLPNDTIGKNLIAVGLVSVLLFGLGIVALNMYLALVILCVQLTIVFHLYDLDFSDCVRYCIISLLLEPLFWVLEQSVFGVLATLALA